MTDTTDPTEPVNNDTVDSYGTITSAVTTNEVIISGDDTTDATPTLPTYKESQDEQRDAFGGLPPSYEVTIAEDVQQPNQHQLQNNVNVAPESQQILRTHGEYPIRTRCPHCRTEITTKVSYVPGGLTYIMMFVIFLIGGICFCFLIPLCIPGLKDAVHQCPRCKTLIGRYERLGG